MNALLITANLAVMMGKPVIAGTRITVAMILEKIGAGETVDGLLVDYLHLTCDGILAAKMQR